MKKFLSVLCAGLLLSSGCANGMEAIKDFFRRLKSLRQSIYMTESEKQEKERLEKVDKKASDALRQSIEKVENPGDVEPVDFDDIGKEQGEN